MFAWCVSWWYEWIDNDELIDDLIMHTYIHMHTYTHIHKHIHAHSHTHTHNALPTIYCSYSCHLVIFIYHKSYKQYFDILVNYKKQEISCYKKKKNK